MADQYYANAILDALRATGLPLYYSQLAQTPVTEPRHGVQEVKHAFVPVLAQVKSLAFVDDNTPIEDWLCDDRRSWENVLLRVRPLITRTISDELGLHQPREDTTAALWEYDENTLHDLARSVLPQLAALYNALGVAHELPIAVIDRGRRLLPPHLDHLDSAIFRRLSFERWKDRTLSLVDGTTREVPKGCVPVLGDTLDKQPVSLGAEFVPAPDDVSEAWQTAYNLAVTFGRLTLPLRQPDTQYPGTDALADEVARIIGACSPVGRDEALCVVLNTTKDELARYQLESGMNPNGALSPRVLSAVDSHLGNKGFTTTNKQVGGDRRKRRQPPADFFDTVPAGTSASWRGCLDALRRGDIRNPFVEVKDQC